jgi:NADP-dependent 3-hydroxy acid dehydrogenase YdfG
MVNLKTIRASNQSLQSLAPGIVAVFAGATSGIGLATLKQFAKYVNAPKAFIIGRNKEKGNEIIDDLKTINSSGTYVFIQGEFSLIKEVDRISAEIKKHVAEEEKGENHIDILCMSTNYLSLGKRKGSLFPLVYRDLTDM